MSLSDMLLMGRSGCAVAWSLAAIVAATTVAAPTVLAPFHWIVVGFMLYAGLNSLLIDRWVRRAISKAFARDTAKFEKNLRATIQRICDAVEAERNVTIIAMEADETFSPPNETKH